MYLIYMILKTSKLSCSLSTLSGFRNSFKLVNVANISMPESSKGSEMFISDTRVSCPTLNAEWTLGPDLLLLGTNICFVK